MVASQVLCSSRNVSGYSVAISVITSLLVVALNPTTPSEPSGAWDSIHVFEAAERGRQAHYKLTSTIMLSMVHRGTGPNAQNKDKDKDEKLDAKREGETTLSGSMTRQVSSRANRSASQ